MKSMTILFLVMIISLSIAFAWDRVPIIKDGVHLALDPSVGKILDWNKTFGLIIITLILSFIMNLVQKYGTDQETLKQIKAEQKELQKEMKEYKDNPEKIMELNKKQLEMMPHILKTTMRPIMYTMVPFILLFRWFGDYFSVVEFRFFGFLSWFWMYLILSIVFSQIFRKVMKIA